MKVVYKESSKILSYNIAGVNCLVHSCSTDGVYLYVRIARYKE